MTKVAILPEPTEEGGAAFRAISGQYQSVAKTAGEALDALTAQLPPGENGTLVIVQTQQPDRFFTSEQQQRLGHLMARWREQRNAGLSLSPSDQAELDTLVDAELRAAGKRAAALGEALGQ